MRLFKRNEEKRPEANTQLLEGARVGDITRVSDALKKGADVNTSKSEFHELMRTENIYTKAMLRDAVGVTALMYAIGGERLDMALLLLENGADLEAKDRYGQTALMYALNRGNFKIVQLLLEKGADFKARAFNGEGCKLYAREEIWKIVIEHERKINEVQVQNSALAGKQKIDEIVNELNSDLEEKR